MEAAIYFLEIALSVLVGLLVLGLGVLFCPFGVIQPRAIYENFRTPLDETLDDINALLGWPEEWDGYQMAPSRESVMNAFGWIKRLYGDLLATGERWLGPLVGADAHGNVVFEWWEDHKKLTVYVRPETVEYIKVWGPDIFSDMEDGEVERAEDHQALWHWLTTS